MRKPLRSILVGLSCLAVLPVAVILLLTLYGAALYSLCDFKEPALDASLSEYALSVRTDSLRVCGNNTLRLDDSGLWEVRVEGPADVRGAVYGLLCRDLLEYQEDAFVKFIHGLIPSESYVRFLHGAVMVFNRSMASHIPSELRSEIAAMSLSCTREYDVYGSPYVRQLNYHAAHDIGHAMQEYMLVGCSSFAVHGSSSAGGELLIGRNFDFHAGDAFAENKVVLFVKPDSGYRFASVSWPGMMGVVSGMNEKGLTVTLNAAKGRLPLSSAMPVSLLARMILQYASDMDEALAIARAHSTFVSESFLIGSAADGCAAVIEKTPQRTELYSVAGERLVCTNHYQSQAFADDRYNVENMASSDSRYRHERLCELIEEHAPLTPAACAEILRDRFGKGGADIGLANEKSINQFAAHHSVIFSPSTLRMWVSTAPWQCGGYVCYDLHKVFGCDGPCFESLADAGNNIPPDARFFSSGECERVAAHRAMSAVMRRALASGEPLPEGFAERFIANNPCFYGVYDLAGDCSLRGGDAAGAVRLWRKALSCEIPHLRVRGDIEKKIHKYDKKQRAAL